MVGIKTNADIFADRGDPWVSDKEGRTQYGRIESTENPEFDRYFAKTAPVKVEPKSEARHLNKPDAASRLANAARKMNAKLAKVRKSDIRRLGDDEE